jgi:hypothetical protein
VLGMMVSLLLPLLLPLLSLVKIYKISIQKSIFYFIFYRKRVCACGSDHRWFLRESLFSSHIDFTPLARAVCDAPATLSMPSLLPNSSSFPCVCRHHSLAFVVITPLRLSKLVIVPLRLFKMRFLGSSTFLLLCVFSANVQARMRMSEPPSIRSIEEGFNVRDDDHFPLSSDGSNFPCQNSHRDPGHNPVRNYTAGEIVQVQYSPHLT